MHAKTEAEINSFTQVHKTIIKISMQGFKSDSNKNALNTAGGSSHTSAAEDSDLKNT